ncbi:MAG: peptidoglycan DD-metalloendopeptidase family protein [Spirochaetota bacterium]
MLIRTKIKSFLHLFSFAIFLVAITTSAQSKSLYVNHKYKLHAFAFLPKSDITGIVYPNEKVKVLYYEEDLSRKKTTIQFKIKTRSGLEGFIPSKYLQKKHPRVPKSKIAYERFTAKNYYVAASVLNVRKKPSLTAEILYSLPQDHKVNILKYSSKDDFIAGHTAKWAYISDHKKVRGWVFSYYLASSPKHDVEKEDKKQKQKKGEEKFVKLDKLTLYQLPIALSQQQGKLKKNAKVKIVKVNPRYETLEGIRSQWVYIERIGKPKQKGWVFGGFLKDSKKKQKKDKVFGLPIKKGQFKVTSKYGMRYLFKKRKFHTGLDLYGFKRQQTFIYAVADGKVIVCRRVGNYGKLTVIQHDNGLVTYYAHQSVLFIREGAIVEKGESIGKVGSTGKSTGPHLHFEVRNGYGKKHFNPQTFLKIP